MTDTFFQRMAARATGTEPRLRARTPEPFEVAGRLPRTPAAAVPDAEAPAPTTPAGSGPVSATRGPGRRPTGATRGAPPEPPRTEVAPAPLPAEAPRADLPLAPAAASSVPVDPGAPPGARPPAPVAEVVSEIIVAARAVLGDQGRAGPPERRDDPARPPVPTASRTPAGRPPPHAQNPPPPEHAPYPAAAPVDVDELVRRHVLPALVRDEVLGADEPVAVGPSEPAGPGVTVVEPWTAAVTPVQPDRPRLERRNASPTNVTVRIDKVVVRKPERPPAPPPRPATPVRKSSVDHDAYLARRRRT